VFIYKGCALIIIFWDKGPGMGSAPIIYWGIKMKCFDCDKGELKIVNGWESRKALKCNHCGHYHYWVDNIYRERRGRNENS
jgi:hypothetical protein